MTKQPIIARLSSYRRGRWFRIITRVAGIIVALLILAYICMAWYINSHKKEILDSITEKVNANIDGTLSIGDMEPTFLSGFPRVSLRLSNVTLRDLKYQEHKRELLRAGNAEVALNVLAFLRGTIEIRKVSIADASVNLFTGADGYSNTAIFRKSQKNDPKGESSLSAEFRMFRLENVRFKAENLKAKKSYDFEIIDLSGDVDFSDSGWHTQASLTAVARQMSFSTRRGSFIEGKKLKGDFDVSYADNGKLTVAEKRLKIGEENFTVAAEFGLGEKASTFSIHIKNKEILWDKAAELVSNNISSRLDLFDLSEPISVSCDIVGNFNKQGDPLIYVKARIRDNTLKTPGGTIEKCNFDGVFTNNYIKEKGFNDPNSAILLHNLNGEYGSVPFEMKEAAILDLENPFAKGTFRAAFKLEKLNNLVDGELLKFSAGDADIAVDFTADIVNYKLTKPKVAGKVAITGANVSYVARKMAFNDVSIGLDFTDKDLFIRNIVLKSGKSTVRMDGKVLNFLNLYYSAPEKIVLNWNVYSPQLHLGEFIGYLGQRQKRANKAPKKPGNFTSELTELFEKSNVNMAMKVDKLFYKSFEATNATAILFVSDSAIVIKKAGLYHAGGTVLLNGQLSLYSRVNRYSLDALVKKVDIRRFFKAFDNFGLESMKSENLNGELYVQADLSGNIREDGALVPNTMNGKAAFTLKNGSLQNFAPIKSVGKYAFPLRDMDNISFSDLNGTFRIQGEKVTVEPMKISSSVLNLDIAGVYSFGKGTNLAIDVPLRNPKKDEKITDKELLEKRRKRGIVLHLLASDDEKTGKVKIGLGKNKDD